jgi:TRAP-type mannitol/chloroaromatic compound transport system permease large subunit
MAEFMIANMAPIMFASLIVFLLAGFPVAFSLGANGILFGLIGIQLGLLHPALFSALPERVFGIMSNDTLLAVTFFTFMGLVLERSGMAEDLLDTIGQLFGPIRGGLAYAVIFVGALLAATTGVVAASVISMGLISLPIMMRYGYNRAIASGVIAASGTLAQIIPPSLVLIIMADQLGRSVGDMYEGAFVPGLVLAGLYTLFVFGVTLVRPHWVPALPDEARTIKEDNGSTGMRSVGVLTLIAAAAAIVFAYAYKPEAPKDERIIVSMAVGIGIAFFLAVINRLFKFHLLSRMAEKVTFVLIPPLALIFLVLGTIFLGIATPTEGGAMGGSGAMILALAKRRISFQLLKQAMDSTAKLTTFVVFILVGARVFSLSFYAVDGHLWVEHLLTSLPGGQLGFLIVVNLLIFVLAFFLDFFELSFIIIPLVGPVAEKLGIDLIWFGILLGVNMQTSFMHPPFGFALFYLRSVAPRSVKTSEIYWGAVPFVLIQVLMVALIIIFPGLVSYGDAKSRAAAQQAPVELNLKQIEKSEQEDQPPAAPSSAAPGAPAPAAPENDSDLARQLRGEAAPPAEQKSSDDDLAKRLRGEATSPAPAPAADDKKEEDDLAKRLRGQ